MNDRDPASRAKRYSAVKVRIFLADLAVTVISLFVFQVCISRPASGMASGVFRNFYPACFIYVTVFLGFMYVIEFPLRFLGSFFLEHRFGLSDQSFPSWLFDEAKSAMLTFVVSMLAVQAFYLILRNFHATWWVIAAFLWIFFSIVVARLLPVIVIPLFFKYSPITDDTLKERIRALGKKAGIRILDVCQIDFSRKTRKANAALVGLGGTRKVILADTLIDGFTPEEVESVAAHEFGHHKYRHIWQLIIFSGLMTLTGFFLLSRVLERISVFAGATGVSDLYIFPCLVFLMICFSMVILPLQNLFSRRLEREADSFALEITGSPRIFISMMRKLASRNLADEEPSKLKKIFFYDHPPVGERIRMAERCDEEGT